MHRRPRNSANGPRPSWRERSRAPTGGASSNASTSSRTSRSDRRPGRRRANSARPGDDVVGCGTVLEDAGGAVRPGDAGVLRFTLPEQLSADPLEKRGSTTDGARSRRQPRRMQAVVGRCSRRRRRCPTGCRWQAVASDEPRPHAPVHLARGDRRTRRAISHSARAAGRGRTARARWAKTRRGRSRTSPSTRTEPTRTSVTRRRRLPSSSQERGLELHLYFASRDPDAALLRLELRPAVGDEVDPTAARQFFPQLHLHLAAARASMRWTSTTLARPSRRSAWSVGPAGDCRITSSDSSPRTTGRSWPKARSTR